MVVAQFSGVGSRGYCRHMVRPAAAVIIPAHNEQNTITRCLEALEPGIDSGELEVVVVCNGCTDRTAQLARSFSPRVQVIETRRGNKAHALNLGDEVATVFPRLYLDADVQLTADDALAIANGLNETGGEVAAPNLAVRVTDRSWPVQAYYRTWTRLPYIRNGVVGAGLYAVSERGRARWGQFPDLLGEDDFVRRQFEAEEIVHLPHCSFVIDAPMTLRDLIRIRTRTNRGMLQLAGLNRPMVRRRKSGYRRALKDLIRSPRAIVDTAVYAAIWGYTTGLARLQYRFSANKLTWTRDESARQAAQQDTTEHAVAAAA